MHRFIRVSASVFALIFTLAFTLAGISPAFAESPYPNRPIKLIVTYPAGGGNDLIARIFAQKLTQTMGVSVIGGLILSTILTLVIVPASFSLAIGFEDRLAPIFGRWLTTGGKNARPPVPQAAE